MVAFFGRGRNISKGMVAFLEKGRNISKGMVAFLEKGRNISKEMVAFFGKAGIFPRAWWHFLERREYFQGHGGIFRNDGNISKEKILDESHILNEIGGKPL